MVTQYIAVEKAVDPYKKTLQPYTHLLDVLYISPIIAYKNEKYYILSFKKRTNNDQIRSFVFMKETGEIITDREETKALCHHYFILHLFGFALKEMKSDASARQVQMMEESIQRIDLIETNINTVLSEEEEMAITDLRASLKNIISIRQSLQQYASECLTYEKQLKKLSHKDTISEAMFEQLYDALEQRGFARQQYDIEVIRLPKDTKQTVDRLLKRHKSLIDKQTYKQVSNILEQMDHLEQMMRQSIQKDFHFFNRMLDTDFGPNVTLSNATYYLQKENRLRLTFAANIVTLMQRLWLFADQQ